MRAGSFRVIQKLNSQKWAVIDDAAKTKYRKKTRKTQGKGSGCDFNQTENNRMRANLFASLYTEQTSKEKSAQHALLYAAIGRWCTITESDAGLVSHSK